jgi:predicted ArsR family transcriptional regulator
MAQDFAARASGIGALAEPARRALYDYVAAQPHAVSRDQAATATGIARHTVKFHLDKLVEEGLLGVEFRRLTGREGPGAGRPAKLYHRVAEEISVSLPERHYELAGRILAAALEQTPAGPSALAREAAAAGRELASGQRSAANPPAPGERVEQVMTLLRSQGYEPRREGDTVVMANCPFHLLAREHPDLVCGLNLELLRAVTAELGSTGLRADLDPCEGRCCVVLRPTTADPRPSTGPRGGEEPTGWSPARP